MAIKHIDASDAVTWFPLCGEPIDITLPSNCHTMYFYARTEAAVVWCQHCENHPDFGLHLLAVTELE